MLIFCLTYNTGSYHNVVITYLHVLNVLFIAALPCCLPMGFWDKLVNLLGFKKREVNILVVGLNNSGKSTVINHFKSEEEKSTEIVPTVGFNVEKFRSEYRLCILFL